MTGESKTLDKCIFYYENVTEVSERIKELSSNDVRGWKINNEDATEWENGKKIVGYDEYEIMPSFSIDFSYLTMMKNIFDTANEYSSKNLTSFFDLEKPVIRKYYPKAGFFELESPDLINPSRKISSILFLNDCSEGGEVCFKNFDLYVSPKQGDAIFFPSSFAYSFKINRPKNEENFVVISHFA